MWFKFDFKRVLWVTLSMTVGCLALWAGYFNKYDTKSMIGTYVSNEYLGDVITLKNNHTYTHQFISSNKKTYHCEGNWTLLRNQVSFDDFLFFTDVGPSSLKSTWAPRITKKNGSLSLIYADDSDIYYTKQ